MKFIIFLLLNFPTFATIMVSHKGIWKDHIYPQNSMAAINQAFANGFNGIEFDVQMTSRGRVVLAHDDKLNGVSNCKGRISELSWLEIKNCVITKNTLLPLTQILTKRVEQPQKLSLLVDVLAQIGLKHNEVELIWIDFKPTSITKAQSLASKLLEYPHGLDKIVVNSTSVEVLSIIKSVFPNMRTSLEGKWGSEPLKDYRKYFDGLGVTHDVISLNVGFYLGHEKYWPIGRRRRFWKKYKKFQEEAYIRDAMYIGWTVNKKKKISKLRDSGIPYLLTDRINP